MLSFATLLALNEDSPVHSLSQTAFRFYEDAAVTTTFVNESIDTDPSTGSKLGDTTFVSGGGGYLRFQTATNFTAGQFEYTGSLGQSFIMEADFWAGGGTGADAAWFYWGAALTPTQEDSAQGQYAVVLNEFANSVQLRWDGSVIASALLASLDNSTWRTLRVECEGDTITVAINGVPLFSHTDTTRTLGGTRYGWAGRSGGQNNEHRVRNIFLRDVADPVAIAAQNTNITRTVTSDSPLLLNVRLQEVNGVAGLATDDYQLQYSLNSGSYNSVEAAPVTGTAQTVVSVTGDDARNISGDSTYTNTAATHHLGNFSGTTFVIGWRFQLFVPQGAIIDSANLTMFVSNVNGGTSALVRFHGEDVDNAATFANTTAGKPEGKTKTTASVDHTFTASNWTSVGFQTNSAEIPNLAAIVQEIVDRPGWVSGNFIVITAADNGSTNPGFVGFSTLDSASNRGSKFDIAYHTVNSDAVVGNVTSNMVDTAPTTNRLGAGSGSFVAGGISEDGIVDNLQITASNYTELLYALTVPTAAVANNDTLDFRVLRNGAVLDAYTVTPRITVSKISGATVTPGVATLTTATFTPTVATTNNIAITLNTSSLTLTAFTPSAILNEIVTPGTASLSLSPQTPQVAVSDNKSATPGIATLTTTLRPPTVAATNNLAITLQTASLTLSPQAPNVSATDNKSIALQVTSLSATLHTPTVLHTDNKTATPGTASLTATTYAPNVQVTSSSSIVPGSAPLSTTLHAPTVAATNNIAVTPGTASLTLTTHTPIIDATNNVAITLQTAALSTSAFALTVEVDLGAIEITPGVAAMLTAMFAPAVAVSQNTAVTPGVARLQLRTSYPIVNGAVRERNYYIDSNGAVYWVINQNIGLVERI